uniref:Peptidyl-prolyl cis-trans isomerase n=1 Tax=Paramoeba aestuarina TaxID=180227 RepID=A0A7S4K1Y5_9EUKA|mmetsp:Transcript_14831/g.23209  ORF Transcript_14831/g.23209 Transcript_14831/m.23209 type:complete len:108 (+) Transcript_14831:316-639(+)
MFSYHTFSFILFYSILFYSILFYYFRSQASFRLDDGSDVPPAEFGKLAMEYSDCSSGKKGGDLGWFPRGKMVGAFQDVAFNTPVKGCSNVFKTSNGYHIFLCEGRKA